jgi:hypothetical protein
MTRNAVLKRTLGNKGARKFLTKPPKSKPASVTLDLPLDLIEQLVVQELTATYGSMTTDLAARKAGKGSAIFDTDRDLDIKTLEGHLFCLETILKYYGTTLK